MRIRTLGFALALALVLPASALADSTIQPPPPGQPQIFAQSEPKAGFGAIEVDVDCERPAHDGDQTCSTKLDLIVNGQTVDSRVVTVPLDGNDVVYDVDVAAIRDKALLGKGKISENLKAYSADGSVFLNETPRTDSAFAGWNKRIAQDCFHERVLAGTGELPVTTKPGANVPKLQLKNVVPVYFDFTTGNRNMVVKFNGLTYVINANTTARFDCVTFFTSGGPVLVPTVFLSSGMVAVLGKPTHQIATALVTREATFRTLKPEKVNFSVERVAKQRLSLMNVTEGKTTQATHLIGGGADFRCTPGKTIRVGPKGIIRAS